MAISMREVAVWPVHLAQEGEGEAAWLAQGSPQQAPLHGRQLRALGHSHMLQEPLRSSTHNTHEAE